jgi:hypothetical protein
VLPRPLLTVPGAHATVGRPEPPTARGESKRNVRGASRRAPTLISGRLGDEARGGVRHLRYSQRPGAQVLQEVWAGTRSGRRPWCQVTVLFADLKGSMELLADRDPEEALAPRSRPHADDGRRPPLRGHRQPGHGRRDHGLLRSTLAPEDHAVRACYAALRMQEAVTYYADMTAPESARVARRSSPRTRLRRGRRGRDRPSRRPPPPARGARLRAPR